MKTKRSFRILCLVLAVLSLFPASVMAADHEPMPAAAYYLQYYTASVNALGDGQLQLSGFAAGTGVMDEVGFYWMVLRESTDNENFYHVKTYLLENYPNLMSYNTSMHSSTLTYQGVPGRYYKAYVYVWAGADGEGDSRYFWTSVTLAT